MKLCFTIFLFIIIVSLSAQISNPMEINEEYGNKMSSNQRAYQIVDEAVYITYRKGESYIYLTRIS
ncbi:MAG: hypothetical protein HOD64_10770, partial [Candidatus Cloacimonetes bacterium]|nr:hypothetical protein [Candidatus Cloacimonadota bacterium]MBT4333747.1 hypothetical protein [Candidatus Cloacimonadota bacterium]